MLYTQGRIRHISHTHTWPHKRHTEHKHDYLHRSKGCAPVSTVAAGVPAAVSVALPGVLAAVSPILVWLASCSQVPPRAADPSALVIAAVVAAAAAAAAVVAAAVAVAVAVAVAAAVAAVLTVGEAEATWCDTVLVVEAVPTATLARAPTSLCGATAAQGAATAPPTPAADAATAPPTSSVHAATAPGPFGAAPSHGGELDRRLVLVVVGGVHVRGVGATAQDACLRATCVSVATAPTPTGAALAAATSLPSTAVALLSSPAPALTLSLPESSTAV